MTDHNRTDASGSWESRLLRDGRRIVVLDDDPTGTQTVSEVSVILRPSKPAYRKFFAGNDRTVYVLTNTRAMPRRQAVRLVSKIRKDVEKAAEEAGERVAFLLRGDSTLRGHIFAEIDAFAEAASVSLFVPAFPEGGRVTIGGVHYLETGGRRIPVAQTEFAKDMTFGYTSENMADWVAEIGDDRPVVLVPLLRLREVGPEAVASALLEAPAGAVIIPDAETRSDLEKIAAGLLEAEERGRRVVVRSASTFVSVRAALRGAMISQAGVSGRVLVVCGSHTAASTRQLEKLTARSSAPVLIPTDTLLSEGADALVPGIAAQIRATLERDRFAVLATERVRKSAHGDLGTGAKVMAAITSVVRAVAPDCDAVVSKGGITSAQVATDGLQAVTARVKGQLEPGVSLWEIQLPGGRLMKYAVIPGNVGHDSTIVDVVGRFGICLDPRGESDEPSVALNFPGRGASPVTEIARKLMEFFISGSVRPGQRIPSERQLSEQFHIGRSTLREALKALTILGLLEVRQGDGTYLKRVESPLLPQTLEWGLLLGEKRALDLIEARQKIEVDIVELAAERRSEAEADSLHCILVRMKEAGDDVQRFVEADVDFHMALAEAARNTALKEILRSIRSLLRAWITSVIQTAGSTQFSYEEHADIFEGIRAGDAAAAGQAMERHMASARERLSKAISGAEGLGEPSGSTGGEGDDK